MFPVLISLGFSYNCNEIEWNDRIITEHFLNKNTIYFIYRQKCL